MRPTPIVVLAVTLPFVTTVKAARADSRLSGCYDIVAGTFSAMETSPASNQGVFHMRLRHSERGEKRQVVIAGIQSAVATAVNDELVFGYTLTDFLRTGQMNLVGHIAAEPQVIDQCIADDGSTQPIMQYTIDILPESGTGRFAGLHAEGGITIKGTVEYCGNREDFSAVHGGTVCF